ncbi:MAG TPA: tetratricopeptide repeat protein [Coxiellaceae bacterium]|nr:tetratricopeptide repeat protein [Coxiellaceae bacterium]
MLFFYSVLSSIALLAGAYILWVLRTHRYWAALTAFIMVAFALFLYFYWGAYQPYARYLFLSEHRQDIARLSNEYKQSPERLITELKKHVEANPDRAEGWYLLGNLYLSTQQYSSALRAYTQAYQLDPNTPTITLRYAEAALLAHKTLSEEEQHQVERLLVADPQNFQALHLLGLNAYLNHQPKKALDYFERVLPLLPETGPQRAQVLAIMAELQKAPSRNQSRNEK